jgi:hypothetical protein
MPVIDTKSPFTIKEKPPTQAGVSSTATPSLSKSKSEASSVVAGRLDPSGLTIDTSASPASDFVKSTKNNLSSNRSNLRSEFAIRNVFATNDASKATVAQYKELVNSIEPQFVEVTESIARFFKGSYTFRRKTLKSIQLKLDRRKELTLGMIDEENIQENPCFVKPFGS